MSSFADVLAAELAAVAAGTTNVCGFTCVGCHGGATCIRAVHDDDHHVGRDADGQLVQWHGVCDAATHEAALAAAVEDRAQRTRDFLAGLDPDILRDFMNGATQ